MSNLRSNQEIVVTQELLNQSTDTALVLNGLEPLTTWASGNNATFLGGGTLQGTFTKETAAPISGTESYRYVQAAGSLNDYIASPIYAVPEKLRGKGVFLEFPYKYNGNNDDIELILWDVTNVGRIPLSGSELLDAATNVNILKINCDIPQTCTQIRVGIQVKVLNSTRILIFDDVRVQLQATTEVQNPVLVQEADSVISLNTSNGYGSSATRIRRFSNLVESRGTDILYQDSATNGASFTIQTDGIYGISFTESAAVDQEYTGLSVNAVSLTTGIETTPVSQRLVMNRISGSLGHVAWEGYLKAGDIVRAHTNGQAASTPSHSTFIIAKAKQLKIVNASQDNKIEIPTSVIQMSNPTGRGAVDTAIVRYSDIDSVIGSGLTLLSDGNSGTRIVVNRSGILNVTASAFLNAATQSMYLSRNQTVLTSTPNESESLARALGSTLIPNVTWSGKVNAGDIIRVASTINPSTGTGTKFVACLIEDKISVSVSNTLPQFSQDDSTVRLEGGNGYGSTATTTRRFASVVQNLGTDIQYVDSATLGGQFIVQSDGVYNVSYSEISTVNTTDVVVSIRVNGTILAYGQQQYNTANTNAKYATCSWQGFLSKGDVITGVVNTAASNNASDVRFTMSKVGKPNVTGVDVTPFANMQLYNASKWEQFVPVFTAFGTVTNINFYKRRNGSNLEIIGRATSGTLTGAELRFGLPDNLITSSILTNLSIIGSAQIGNNAGALNGIDVLANGGLGYLTFGYRTNAGTSGLTSTTDAFNSNAAFSFFASVPIQGWEAYDNAVATVNDIFNSDSNTLTYAGSATYTLSTLANAPVGTFITWTYAANGNTATQTNAAAPTQTTSDMNTNGIRIYPRAFNASSTAAQPARVAIQIGKGLKGVSLRGYSATGKVGQIALDNVVVGNTERGITQSYNETTGVLILDAGLANTGTGTARDFIDTETVNTTAVCYIVINAAKTPDLSVIAPNNRRIAVLKDVKASGTAGGSFTSGSYQTRTLNDEFDPNGFVTLTGNQFTLTAGTYKFSATVPAYRVNIHKAKLRNITDSTDTIIGQTSNSENASGDASFSNIEGTFTITASKTFEIQHRCSTTQASSGFGFAASFADSEVYTQAVIEKIN